jgi:hypothetical protein
VALRLNTNKRTSIRWAKIESERLSWGAVDEHVTQRTSPTRLDVVSCPSISRSRTGSATVDNAETADMTSRTSLTVRSADCWREPSQMTGDLSSASVQLVAVHSPVNSSCTLEETADDLICVWGQVRCRVVQFHRHENVPKGLSFDHSEQFKDYSRQKAEFQGTTTGNCLLAKTSGLELHVTRAICWNKTNTSAIQRQLLGFCHLWGAKKYRTPFIQPALVFRGGMKVFFNWKQFAVSTTTR